MRTLDELALGLRDLKLSCGDPSITTITKRVHALWSDRPVSELPARSTVGNCFLIGRRRPNVDLVLAVVEVLAGPAALGEWRQALHRVLGSGVVVTSALPADLPSFVGPVPDVPASVVLTGMPGAGKTTLAVHIGHSLRHGPALFVRLGLLDPAAVLESADYRRTLKHARPLVVLDDATSADQVRPLLPRHGQAIVTSRRRLPGLPSLTVSLTPASAAELVCRLAAPRRLDPVAVGEIVARLGYHPQALTVIGRHLARHPEWTLADYLEPLQALALEGGVRESLASADRALPVEARRLLRLLALHPGPEFGVRDVAALAGWSPERARGVLDVLLDAHLLQPGHRFHPLVRAFAVERSGIDHPVSCHRRALARLWQSSGHAARTGAPA